MRKHAYSDPVDTATDADLDDDGSTPNGGLPNRLMTAFEVAEFVGCHEETVRRAYLRGLLASQWFGIRGRRVYPADVLEWFRRGAPPRVSYRREDMYGCSQAVSQQGLQDEPALRPSLVAGRHAQRRSLPHTG